MTDQREPDLPVPDLLAIELALGLLDEPERRAAQARVDTDPPFAAEVAQWRDRALTLFDRDAQMPPAALWPAIVARLPANDTREVVRWRWATGAALAAALLLGVIAVRPPPPVPVPVPEIVAAAPAGHPLVALLQGTKGTATGGATLAVSIDPGGRGLTTTPAALDLGERAAELWVIPTGGTPLSLGVLPQAPRWRPVPEALAGRLAVGATLAVSVEPAGGSRTGLPTGPVILSARITPT